MYLSSDFRDFYDHWFESNGDVGLERTNQGVLSKIEALDLLVSLGIPTVEYGNAEFARSLQDEFVLVITNPYGHAGLSFMKIDRTDAMLHNFGDAFIRYYEDALPYTIRALYIGDSAYHLVIRNGKHYKSNVDTESIFYDDFDMPKLLSRFSLGALGTQFPLYAVDFIELSDGRLLACDLNTSPGMRHTPLRDMIPPVEVATKIQEAVARIGEGPTIINGPRV